MDFLVNAGCVKCCMGYVRVIVAAEPTQERFRDFMDLLLVIFDVDVVGFQEWNELLLEFREGVACDINV